MNDPTDTPANDAPAITDPADLFVALGTGDALGWLLKADELVIAAGRAFLAPHALRRLAPPSGLTPRGRGPTAGPRGGARSATPGGR